MIRGPLVIRCLGIVGRVEAVHHDGVTPAGEYLERYDPEAHGGRGDVTFTRDIARARVFPDVGAVWECIRTRPKARPTRPDGTANRPLMAFTLQILPRASVS